MLVTPRKFDVILNRWSVHIHVTNDTIFTMDGFRPTTNKAFDNIEILEHARHFIRLAIASYGSLPWVYFGYSFKVAPLSKYH